MCGTWFDGQGAKITDHSSVVLPGGHIWGSWQTDEAANCIHTGREVRHCQRNTAHAQYRETPKTDHVIGDPIQENRHEDDQFITYDEVYYCTVCGDEVKRISRTTSKLEGRCFIATSIYGSYDCPQVWTLRRFRDDVLATCPAGREFIRGYYAISPGLVRDYGDEKWFRSLWKPFLDSLVQILNE